MFRKEFEDYVPYRVLNQPKYDLGNNENRIIDWSFLLAETAENLTLSDLTYYGDNYYFHLLEAYAAYLHVEPEQLAIGVGSDFLIHMIVTAFLEKDDVCLTVAPDFFMYQVYNQMHGSRFVSHPLEFVDGRLQLLAEPLLAKAEEMGAKILMFSNPNNPASVGFQEKELEKILSQFKGLVVIDEAYIEFSDLPSFANRVGDYDNLIVLRTLSKAFGLAGIRIGFAVSNPRLSYELNKVIPPFSIPNITTKMGAIALKHWELVSEAISAIRTLRQEWMDFLQSLPDCQVLPSQTSFLTFTAPWTKRFHQEALKNGWNFKYYDTGLLAGYIRLSIGRPEEMAALKSFMIDFLMESTDSDAFS